MIDLIPVLSCAYRRQPQAAKIVVGKARGVYRGRRPGTTRARPELAHHLRTRSLVIAEIANALGVSERTVYRYVGRASSCHRAAV